jgi:hypothetical protein
VTDAAGYIMKGKIAQHLASKDYIKKLMETPADLSEFRERPTPRLITGLALMILSFILGWPAVFAFSALAVWFREPLLGAVGGLFYILSYGVFIVGAWLSRAPHFMGILTKYCMQSLLNKLFFDIKVN